MSNRNQNAYPDDLEREGPVDESGLVGEFDSPNNTGLAGSPDAPDNSGLVGTGQIDAAGNAGYDTYDTYDTHTDESDQTGLVGTTGAAETYGAGADYTGQNSAELPDQQLLQPGYNPEVGDAGRLQDLERDGPNPTGYTGASDRDVYANRNDENAPAGPDADMRPNDTEEQTGY